MDYKELEKCLSTLDREVYDLEELYINNEGECTEETDQKEQAIAALRELMSNEGIDMLGSWLKAKEDKKKALKAEKDHITRQMGAIDETMEFIKRKVNEVLAALGTDKVKGTRGYSFTSTTSVKTEINKDNLKSIYADRAEQAIRAAAIPAYIGISLTASSTKAAEVGVDEGDEVIFETTETPSVRFTKPRASKEA